MENKINIADLLRNCPKGMELDCMMYVNPVRLEEVTIDERYPIIIKLKNDDLMTLTEYGSYDYVEDAKCIIFPKGKTTWEGFVPPCKFKVGDVVISTSNNIHLISCYDKNYGGWESCCSIIYDKFDSTKTVHVIPTRFATEEEKQKLFDAIKINGYRWNPETKILEKLIVPKFKVRDKIRHKEKTSWTCKIIKVEDRYYVNEHPTYYTIPFDKQTEYELVPNKFDINTLIPFESRVLVRDTEEEKWKPAIWGYYDVDHINGYPYETVGGNCFCLCIPYKGNEHLLNTTDACNDYFKTWEK